MTWTVTGLLFCFVSIFVGGGILARLGDRISEQSRLGHHLMGMVFLAAVTSLPELAAGVSAAGWSGEADIAYGEVIGSCVFNLTILGVADLFAHKPVVAARGAGLYLNGSTGIILLCVATAALLGAARMGTYAMLFNLVIVGVYLMGLEGARRVEHAPEGATGDGAGLPRLWVLFGLTAFLVVGPGLWLPLLADTLAHEIGISESFAGTFFVGAVTSAPEMIVTYHCLKNGWAHMAVGNLLGSNLFNLLVLVPMDLAYGRESLYAAAGREHAVTALLAIIMTAVVLTAATWRSRQTRVPRWRPEGPVLAVLYVLVFVYLAFL